METTRSATRSSKCDGVVAGDNGVGRVILDAEVFALRDGVEQGQEDIHLLGEFDVFPVAVFVVVFQPEDDVVLAGHGDQLVDGVNDPFQTFFDGHIGIALPGEDCGRRPPARQGGA